MKLSVIVIAYNVQDYINMCLNSLHFQSFDDTEFLIIDDGSTDQTAKRIKKFINEKKDNRFKYYYKENGGQADARNFGMNKARGDFIWFVDGDDYIYFENQLLDDFIAKSINNRLDMLIFNCMFDNHWNKKYANKTMLLTQSNQNITTGIQLLNGNNFNFSVWHMLFKRQFLIDNNILFKKNSDAEDLLFSVQCLLRAERVMYDAKIGYVYVYRNNSITKTHDVKQVTKRIKDVITETTVIDKEIKNRKITDSNLGNLLVSGYIYQALTAFATGYVDIPRKEIFNFLKNKKLTIKEKIKKFILIYLPNKLRRKLCRKILK